MFEAIKKSLGKFDYLLLLVAAYAFTHFNYSDLQTTEIIYIVSFTAWIVMLGIRIFIVYKNEGGR